MPAHLTILASGSGSNAEAIINFFKDDPDVVVNFIVSNNRAAYVLDRARIHNIDSHILNRSEFEDPDSFLEVLKPYQPSLIILAGFLWLIPKYILAAYPDRVINIHPALLPRYGGKGMYGNHVHKAVYENKEKESGITIHYVNENYDEGDIIFQEKISLDASDTPDIIAKKVLKLEHYHYPRVIKNLLASKSE